MTNWTDGDLANLDNFIKKAGEEVGYLSEQPVLTFKKLLYQEVYNFYKAGAPVEEISELIRHRNRQFLTLMRERDEQ